MSARFDIVEGADHVLIELIYGSSGFLRSGLEEFSSVYILVAPYAGASGDNSTNCKIGIDFWLTSAGLLIGNESL